MIFTFFTGFSRTFGLKSRTNHGFSREHMRADSRNPEQTRNVEQTRNLEQMAWQSSNVATLKKCLAYASLGFLFLARRRGAFGTSTDIGTSLTVFLFFCFWHVEGALLARRRTLGPCLTVFLLSVFRRSTVGTSTDIGTSLTVFLFFCFWHVEGALLARRRSAFGTSTDIGTSLTVFLFFGFWHVEGALLARRRTLGPALQFFCFPFFSRSKEQFWHVDGHPRDAFLGVLW